MATKPAGRLTEGQTGTAVAWKKARLEPGVMRAFVMKRIGEVGFAEKPIPDPAPNDAIVKTKVALICTSDAHTVEGAIGERKNLTLGHEAVGTVYKLGSEVRGFCVGQRVAINAITPCYQCENCLRGFSSQCTQLLGGWKFANGKDGNLAEYFHVNNAVANLARIPSRVRDEQAVYCTHIMSAGLAGAERAAIPLGGSVAIFAQGPVGLMATAGARLMGAGLIIAVETMPQRKVLAKHFGADIVIDFEELDPVKAILKLTDGNGVDSAIEALGKPETFQACVKVTRPGGTICNLGHHGQSETIPLPVPEWGFGMGDKTIRTALSPGGAERMKRLLRLIEAGRIDPTPLMTHRFSFQDVETAFHMMQTKEGGMIKPLIVFD